MLAIQHISKHRIIDMAVKCFLGIVAFTIVCISALAGQMVAVPEKWVGMWVLDISQSTFGTFLMPGLPADFTILSQSLWLQKSAGAIRLSSETVVRDSIGLHSGHDDTSLKLDGMETVIGPVSLSFRPINDSTFEIIGKLRITNRNLGEVSRFSFSSDGGTLTETKTQTEREVVPEGAEETPGAVIRTSTSFLVFSKHPGP